METDPVLSNVSSVFSGVESGVPCLFQVYILCPEPGPFWLEYPVLRLEMIIRYCRTKILIPFISYMEHV